LQPAGLPALRSWSTTLALIGAGDIGEVRTVIASCAEGFSFGGSHLFDLMRYLIGAKASWVFCCLEEDHSLVDPGGDALIVYENGVRVHVYNARTGGKAFSAFDFIGTEGRIRLGRYDFRWWKTQQTDSGIVAVERPFPGRHDGKSGMYTAVEELVQAIETGAEPASTLEDGRAALEITVALLLSGRRGEVVRLPITETSFVAEAMW
jgi:predicted dehydrogenase